MRIMFSFVGGNGHFQPLVPIADAVKSAGHTLVVACSRSMRPVVYEAGFPTLMLGKSKPAKMKVERIPLRPLSIEREEQDLRENFARHGAKARIPDMIAACKAWKPDIIVCDEVDFGSMITADHLGIPHVSVVVIASGSFIRPDVVAEPLNELRLEYGLPLDPDLLMLSRYLVLMPVPPSFRNPAFPLPSTAHPIQPFSRQDAVPSLSIMGHNPSLPTIYFTLGTVFNTESGDLFSRVLTGLRDVHANVIVTVGHQIDPAEFGPQPDHIHIAQYIPQLNLLPHCDLVISHGGSGTVIATLAHGLPMVLLPMGADQIHNAERCQALGAARVLNPLDSSPEIVREAVRSVLDLSKYRASAQRIQSEIGTLPEPIYAVSLLEHLGETKQPVLHH